MNKKLVIFIIIFFFLSSFFTYIFYIRIYHPNIVLPSDNNEYYIDIPTNATFEMVVEILSNDNLLINSNSFEWLAKQKNYYNNIKPGRYKVKDALNNNQLINLLRSGNQAPIKLKFNNLRTKEDLAKKVSEQLELDSISILSYITNQDFLNKLSLDSYNVSCLFIPNTYEFYWNTSAEDFAERMVLEYEKFWNQERTKKAKEIGLTYLEVSILASIVEKEQNIKIDERSDIAGLYLNRINKNMKLESDPTLIFAIGDFSINRVLNKDKKVESPFNTYKYKGLPPGPICIPSINAIDAVLNASDHDYIFMCAKEDFSGYHNFATNYRDHLKNARRYQKELNKRRILR